MDKWTPGPKYFYPCTVFDQILSILERNTLLEYCSEIWTNGHLAKIFLPFLEIWETRFTEIRFERKSTVPDSHDWVRSLLNLFIFPHICEISVNSSFIFFPSFSPLGLPVRVKKLGKGAEDHQEPPEEKTSHLTSSYLTFWWTRICSCLIVSNLPQNRLEKFTAVIL